MEILGIDVGGTGIKGAIVDVTTGKLVSERFRVKTPKGAKPADVADEVAELVNHFNWKGKVGCGFPAIITHGVARSAGNIHKSWIGTNVTELFQQRTGLEFKVRNDADAAGLAAVTFGAGKGVKGLVIMITVGTGIGSGVFYNGVLIPNFEIGAIPYKDYKRVEHYASDSARKRDKLTYEEWGKRFNKFLKLTVFLFSPDMIIIGGGASKKIDKFKDQVTIDVPIVPSQFENEVGIIGAALLAL
jgi:polyphosphate glucokinase